MAWLAQDVSKVNAVTQGPLTLSGDASTHLASMVTLALEAERLAGQFWRQGAMVLVAEPGAGKTTLLPQALLRHPAASTGQIWVLAPRRLAARMAAQYVAKCAGEAVGESIGYRIRFDDCTKAATRIVYMTDGILTRQLLADVALKGVAAVIFDEFHERSLAQDVNLAALCALRTRRPATAPLAIGVMSATLDHDRVAALLGCGKANFVKGRTFAVDVAYAPYRPQLSLPQQVAAAVEESLQRPLDAQDRECGSILVFLPGAQQIHAAMAASAKVAARHGADCLPLYASLSAAEQARALVPSSARRIIFATNVAETSLTLPNVRHVIDSGLCKQARALPLSGITALQLASISQASAVQRAGRAGRVAPGRCVRLYTQADFGRRPPFEVAEVERLDVAPALLFLAQLGLLPLHQLAFVDPVAPAAAAQAQALLLLLGATDNDGRITALGRRMAALPLHPRLARMVLAAEALGIGQLGCEVATALSEDVQDATDLSERCRVVRADPHLRRVARGLVEALRRTRKTTAVATGAPHGPQRPGTPTPTGGAQQRLSQALLAGFADRVAKAAPGQSSGHEPQSLATLRYQMARGGRAELLPGSEAEGCPYVVALDAAARPNVPALDQRTGAPLRLLCAVGIDADELLGGAASLLAERSERRFDAARGKVLLRSVMSYDGLTLLEDERVEDDLRHSLPLLCHAFWRGLGATPAFVAAMRGLEARLQLLDADPGNGATSASELVRTAVLQALAAWAQNDQSLNLLDQATLWPQVLQALPPQTLQQLQSLAPTHVTLGHGKRLAVHYGTDAAPYVESYLQDFFGAARGPVLGVRQVALTLHLWGPNKRPLQVTQDLANFWQVHYPKLRGALQRRYPRHAWPEDPLQAPPGTRRPGR